MPAARLADFAGPALPTVGVGEPAAEIAARIPGDATWLTVLTGGLITGVAARAARIV